MRDGSPPQSSTIRRIVQEELLMQPRELAERITVGQPPVVVDVRTCFEFRCGHIPGAINAPIWKIMLRLASLPSDKQAEMVVLCELGPRAVIARALLGLFGYRNVALLTGHMAAWRRSGLLLEKAKA